MKLSKMLCLVLAMTSNGSAADLAVSYRDRADRLIDAAIADQEGYARLTYLCDRIGNRLSGTPALDRAVEWIAGEMKAAGLSNIQKIPVQVPRWVRGAESAALLAPVARPLHMLGLGMSVATPAGGISADAVVVSDFDELEKLGRGKVAGKIVVYNAPYVSYGATVRYRGNGASRAAALGAVAVLVRSITPHAMQTPHTGALRYDPALPQIPAAAISIEDAELLARLASSGEAVRVHLEMSAKLEADVESADVIGEIPGRNPDQVVVLGGHLDSWDVGQGAHDDGAGIVASLQAVALIHKLGLQPRRTIRVVAWVNEENGQRGAAAYRDWVGAKIGGHVAAIEMDEGSEAPKGFGLGTAQWKADAASMTRMNQIASLLKRIGANEVLDDGSETDTSPLTKDGVPGLGLRTVQEHYFDWHHTIADTLDKVNPNAFRMNVASLAVMSYILADMPDVLTSVKK